MQNSSKSTETRLGLLVSFVVLALVAALAVIPTQFDWEVSSQGKGLTQRTESHVEGLENYDIREQQKSPEMEQALLNIVTRPASRPVLSQMSAMASHAVRNRSRRVFLAGGRIQLGYPYPRGDRPGCKAGSQLPDRPAAGSRVDMLRNFAKQNSELIGVNDEQVNQLKVTADYTNPDGVLSFVHLEQQIDGVPVFRGEIKAGFTKSNEIIRVINNLAPGVEYNSVSKNFGDPLQAVTHAARHINVDVSTLDLSVNESASSDNKTVFGRGDWATTAERIYFPTEPGVVVPAHRVLIWQPVNAFYVIVDANTGTMLWRKNITEDQTQAATYQVYRNTNAMIDVAESPAPLTPGPIDPLSVLRVLFSRVLTLPASVTKLLTPLLTTAGSLMARTSRTVTSTKQVSTAMARTALMPLSRATQPARVQDAAFSPRHGTRLRAIRHRATPH